MSSASELAAAAARPLGPAPLGRRTFFKYAGAAAGASALALAGCKATTEAPQTVAVGLGDGGVLNYAYAIEQVQAAFYAQIRGAVYYESLATGSAERLILDDLFFHETTHRDFLRAALRNLGITPLKNLTFNFTGISFTDRTSVLSAARQLEDLTVAAYNGVAARLTSPALLFTLGKIVSVEARHAAVVRNLLSEGSFVGNDVVSLTENTSLERSRPPADVAPLLNLYLADGSKLDVSGIS